MASSSHTFGEVPKVRILVLGDSGAGKTSLVHQICNGAILKDPRWTVGCQTEVKLQTHPAMNKRFFLEFWDVGGSRKYQQTRQIFYSQINGIMLVFDLNNKKSYLNLRKWIKEIVHVHKTKGIEEKYVYHDAHGTSTTSSYDNHVSSSLGSLPVIVVGNKKDLQDKKNPRTYNTVKDLGFNCVYVSALEKFTTEEMHSLNEYFKRVIERRFYRAHTDKHSSKVLRRGAPASSDGIGDYL
uniref:Uncharacterized protein n=1 Tax=Lotharella globosa TaxID=91324 RepID=A0A6U3DMJ8_9EUKA|mmetsp:Transcript_4681/g.8900  ORF Transcript_4681/g.8900 Transcript_4681/m.8900 type:complete len:239 (-) Transcript_4681:193-909(-)